MTTPATSERNLRFRALGYQRLRILGCLGGHSPSLPRYFDPAPDEDVIAAFRSFVAACVRDARDDPDRITQALVGAARLLTGDLAGADAILAHLPPTPPLRDHFAGNALVAPAEVLSVVLPIARLALPPASRWVAGSEEQARVDDWLAAHRAQLIWDEPEAVYRIAGE